MDKKAKVKIPAVNHQRSEEERKMLDALAALEAEVDGIFENFELGRDADSPYDKLGRPFAMTREVVAKMRHAIIIGCTIRVACIHAGISNMTYYRFIERFPEFEELVDKWKQSRVVLAHQIVYRVLTNPNDPRQLQVAMGVIEAEKPKMDIPLAGGGTLHVSYSSEEKELLKKYDYDVDAKPAAGAAIAPGAEGAATGSGGADRAVADGAPGGGKPAKPPAAPDKKGMPGAAPVPGVGR